MKKLLGLLVAVVFSLTLAACNTTQEEDTDTVLSFDVNPSIEIIVNDEDEVTSIALLNEDAEIALANVELEGLPLDEALDKITEALIETGYVNVDTDENIIVITSSDEGREDEMKEKVEQVLANRGVGAAVFGGEMLEEYFDLAEQYDISVGRARLISRAVDIDADLTFEAALELEHNEIMTILRDEHRAQMDEFIAERRANAQELQDEMREMAEARVQEHRNKLDEGELDTPDFDEIRNRVEGELETIRDEYQQRIEDRRQTARNRRDQHTPDNDATSDSYATLDINPGIELIVDEDDVVLSVGMMNEDAEIILSDLDLIGLPFNEAVTKIVEAAIETGYIDVESNENIVTVTREDAENEAAVKDLVKDILEGNGIGAAIYGGEMLDEYVDLAEAYDISVGRARLISRAVDIDEDLTFEAALELEHSEIMTILQDEHRARMDEFIAERRETAQELKNEMRTMAQERVQQHRDRLEDGEIDLPDFDAILDEIDVDAIRNQYQARIDEKREAAQTRRDTDYPENDQPEDNQSDDQPDAY